MDGSQAKVVVTEKDPRHQDIIHGLKRVYRSSVRPLEQKCHFEQFVGQPLQDSYFDSNPNVMLLGQYSVGKTSFVEYLIGKPYPGQFIGPEPTTDGFVSILHGDSEAQLPGHAAAIQANLPYQGLDAFGSGFLSRFKVAFSDSPFLKYINLIDSPGVLSGDKQKSGRAYDFIQVVRWFATRSDMIIIMFDANKLDICDEMKEVISALQGNEDKIHVILNKADIFEKETLIRVYGALMWSLSRAFNTPEVVKVYVGSFWAHSNPPDSTAQLLHDEQAALLRALGMLPRENVQKRINEMAKRIKMVRCIAALTSHLKTEMRTFGKEKKKEQLIHDLPNIYDFISRKFGFSVNDFPPVANMQRRLEKLDFNQFSKIADDEIRACSNILGKHLPQFFDSISAENGGVVNPFEVEATFGKMWQIDDAKAQEYKKLFFKMCGLNPHKPNCGLPSSKDPLSYTLSGEEAKKWMTKNDSITSEALGEIWHLSDVDKDGALNVAEFILLNHLLVIYKKQKSVPISVPRALVASIHKKHGISISQPTTKPKPPTPPPSYYPVPEISPSTPNRAPPSIFSSSTTFDRVSSPSNSVNTNGSVSPRNPVLSSSLPASVSPSPLPKPPTRPPPAPTTNISPSPLSQKNEGITSTVSNSALNTPTSLHTLPPNEHPSGGGSDSAIANSQSGMNTAKRPTRKPPPPPARNKKEEERKEEKIDEEKGGMEGSKDDNEENEFGEPTTTFISFSQNKGLVLGSKNQVRRGEEESEENMEGEEQTDMKEQSPARGDDDPSIPPSLPSPPLLSAEEIAEKVKREAETGKNSFNTMQGIFNRFMIVTPTQQENKPAEEEESDDGLLESME